MADAKYNFTKHKNDYLTPPELVEAILKKIGQDMFLIDTCCSQKNIPAVFHAVSGIVDGLNISWSGEGLLKEGLNWAYCNPPYDKCTDWVKKAHKEQQLGANSVLLIPARTETKFWHDYIIAEDGFGFRDGVEVQFLRKGVCFLDAETSEKVKIKVGLKDKEGRPIVDGLTGEQAFKLVDGVYKNPLALVYFYGY